MKYQINPADTYWQSLGSKEPFWNFISGYRKTGTLAADNNNAGNIKLSRWQEAMIKRDPFLESVYPTDSEGHRKFEDWTYGYDKTDEILDEYSRDPNTTLRQIQRDGYAEDKNWATGVAQFYNQFTPRGEDNITPDTKIGETDPIAYKLAVKFHEGFLDPNKVSTKKGEERWADFEKFYQMYKNEKVKPLDRGTREEYVYRRQPWTRPEEEKGPLGIKPAKAATFNYNDWVSGEVLEEEEEPIEPAKEPRKWKPLLALESFWVGVTDTLGDIIGGTRAYTPDVIDPYLIKARDTLDSLSSEELDTKVDEASAGIMIPRKWSDTGEFINTWSALVGRNLPIMMYSMIGRGIGSILGVKVGPVGIVAGGFIGGAGTMTLMETENFLQDAQEVGLDYDIAQKYGRFYGPSAGVIEYSQQMLMFSPFKRAFGKAGKPFMNAVRKSLLKKLFAVAGIGFIEGAEELAQGGLERFLLLKAIEDQKKRNPDWEPVYVPDYKDLPREFVAGAGIYFITRGLAKGVGVVTGAKNAGELAEFTNVKAKLQREVGEDLTKVSRKEIDKALEKIAPEMIEEQKQRILSFVTLEETVAELPEVKVVEVAKLKERKKPVPKMKGLVEVEKVIPKELEPLAIEARKYKSAEEFMGINRIKEDSKIVWQTNKEGGQTIGNKQIIRKPTLADFRNEILPRTQKGWYGIGAIEQQYQNMLKKEPRLRVSYVDTGKGYKISKIDDFQNIKRDIINGMRKGWAKIVDDFESPIAKAVRQSIDSEQTLIDLYNQATKEVKPVVKPVLKKRVIEKVRYTKEFAAYQEALDKALKGVSTERIDLLRGQIVYDKATRTFYIPKGKEVAPKVTTLHMRGEDIYDTLKDIYKSEWDVISEKTKFFISPLSKTKKQHFAEAYRHFITDRETLQKVQPEAFDFMRAIARIEIEPITPAQKILEKRMKKWERDYTPEEIREIYDNIAAGEIDLTYPDTQTEMNYQHFVEILKLGSVSFHPHIKEYIQTGDIETIRTRLTYKDVKKLAEKYGDKTISAFIDHTFTAKGMTHDEVLDMFRERVTKENPYLLLGRRIAENLGYQSILKTVGEIDTEKSYEALSEKMKELIKPLELPKKTKRPMLFSLLGNKDESAKMLSRLFTSWVNRGITKFIEPYGGGFVIATHALRTPVETGLKDLNINIFDIEKYIILKNIKQGKQARVKTEYRNVLKTLDKSFVKAANRLADIFERYNNDLVLTEIEEDIIGKIRDNLKKKFSAHAKKQGQKFTTKQLEKELRTLNFEEPISIIEQFREKYPKALIGDDTWVTFLKTETDQNAKVQTALGISLYEQWRVVFQEGMRSLYDPITFPPFGADNLTDAVTRAAIDRIGLRTGGNQRFIGDDGFWGYYNILQGNEGIFKAIDDVNDFFKFTKKHDAKVKLTQGDAVKFLQKIRVDPEKAGYFNDPPYLQEIHKAKSVYEKLEGAQNFASGANIVESHSKMFNPKSQLAMTNDINNEYLESVTDKIGKNVTVFGYREGLTDTSLIIRGKSFGDILTDFLEEEERKSLSPRELLSKKFRRALIDYKIRPIDFKDINEKLGNPIHDEVMYTYEIGYARRQSKKKGNVNTKDLLKILKTDGVRDEVFDQVLVNNARLKDLVSYRVEKTGEITAIISKEQLKYMRDTNNSKLSTREEKLRDREKMHKFKKVGTELGDTGLSLLKWYEIPSKFFNRIGQGFKDIIFTPIRSDERFIPLLVGHMNEQLLPFRKLNREERKRVFAYAAGKQVITKMIDPETKEVVIFKKPVPRTIIPEDQKVTSLTEKEMKAYKSARNLTDKLFPKVQAIASKSGKVIVQIENYFPLYVKKDMAHFVSGSVFHAISKDPYFGSLEAAKINVPFVYYEKDSRKVMSAWVHNASRYLATAEKTNNIQFLLNSEEFQKLLSLEDYNTIKSWFAYVQGNISKPKHPRLAKAIRLAQGSFILGLRYTVPLKQGLNLFDAAVKLPAKDLAWGMKNVIRRKDLSRYIKESPSVIERRMLDITMMDLGNTWFNWMRIPAAYTDRLTARAIKLAVIRNQVIKLMKRGDKLTPETFGKIEAFSDTVMEGIMGAIAVMDTPAAMRTETGKNINMFYSQLNAKIGFHIQDVWLKQNPELWMKLSQSHKAAMVKSALALVIAAMLEDLISKLYWEDDPWEETKDVIYALIGNIPVLGGIAYSFRSGRPWAIAPIMGNLMKFQKELYYIVTSKKPETKLRHLKEAIFTMSGFFGFPDAVLNLMEGAFTATQGKVEVKGKDVYLESWYDYFLTALKGKYGAETIQRAFRKEKTTKPYHNYNVW